MAIKIPITIQEFNHSEEFQERLIHLRNLDNDIMDLLVAEELGTIDEKEFEFLGDKMAQDYAFMERDRNSLGW